MIKLSDHFGYSKLLKFTIPAIGTVIFMSIYSIVDGFFVANFAGTLPFAALNFVYPLTMLLGSVGFLFGTGGSALVAKTLGEGKSTKANQIFSMLVYLSIIVGITFEILGFFLLDDVAKFLGAEGELLAYSLSYGQILMLSLPMFILQFEFQYFFPAAEKPKLGFLITFAAGLTNIVLDALFLAGFGWGLEGAAAATAISQTIGGVLPFIYFFRKNSSRLQLTKPVFDGAALFKTVTNGVSELMSNISESLITMIFNWQLLKYAGSDGVAVFAILMYFAFIFEAVFLGYSAGISPVVSYHYGAKSKHELHSLLRKSLTMIILFAIVMFTSAETFARPLASIFVGADEHLMEMTVHALRIFSFAFLFMGVVIFISAFFTALNNGVLSAVISGLRLAFEISAVLILPLIWGVDGIWASMVSADITAVIIAVTILLFNRKRYGY